MCTSCSLADTAPKVAPSKAINIIDKEKFLRVADDLMAAFSWSSSPEGVDYWDQVHRKLTKIVETGRSQLVTPTEVVISGVRYIKAPNN